MIFGRGLSWLWLSITCNTPGSRSYVLRVARALVAGAELIAKGTVQGADSLYRSSFSLSDEKLNSPTASTPSLPSPSVTPCKAKLGDTKELEEFIADLDRTLASM
ncbi:hypothetical protein CIB84_004517 [Bambusicola thoracicus]|uniref:Regulator of cell cycle RGCC n=1 Tax=Bambusicola thoracicus TaxID=9083 RepID=A0A2P4T5W6_BAMTH|nr:hypothetical protein CIB84_004517 [Bambusicola thoracicus]